jgi:osmotically-inducible protein OsmY
VAKSAEQTKTVGDTIDDSSITAQVKMTLLFHRSTSALKTSVATKDGVVTVSGKAKNAAEKALVGKLANDVKGVKAVENRMIIE